MASNTEITNLAAEILDNLTDNSTALHIIILKAAKLALLVNMPRQYEWLIKNAQSAENSEITKSVFQIKMEAARDPSISMASANPHEYMGLNLRSSGNLVERQKLSIELTNAVKWLAFLRNETFKFTLNVYNKWSFGNIAESIFERKRKKIEPVLVAVLPDIGQRLRAITENLSSNNPEHWKNAVSTCRGLFMDIADAINPIKNPEEKESYMNRIKDFISPKITSKTKKKLLKSFLEEIKKRLEYTLALTQGASHKDRPTLEQANDTVLYTYLAMGEIAQIYSENNVRDVKLPILTESPMENIVKQP